MMKIWWETTVNHTVSRCNVDLMPLEMVTVITRKSKMIVAKLVGSGEKRAAWNGHDTLAGVHRRVVVGERYDSQNGPN